MQPALTNLSEVLLETDILADFLRLKTNTNTQRNYRKAIAKRCLGRSMISIAGSMMTIAINTNQLLPIR
jgi:hypothetical protein